MIKQEADIWYDDRTGMVCYGLGKYPKLSGFYKFVWRKWYNPMKYIKGDVYMVFIPDVGAYKTP